MPELHRPQFHLGLTVRFFAYGSLMFPEVLRAVTGCRAVGLDATLDGFGRFLVARATYPGIIPEPSAYVPGKLYSGLGAAAFRVLDRFEGEYYRRTTVHISGAEAETYVIHPRFQRTLTRQPWNVEAFRRHHLRNFLRRYDGFTWITR